MTSYPQIILKPGKEGPVLRFHPWIFSGAIDKTVGKPAEGDIVECFSSAGTYLATGHCMPGSLAVKLFSFKKQEIDKAFWYSKIREIWQVRKSIGLTDNSSTTAYRLIHNEGDSMPGLIVDVYGSMAVLQAHSTGMHDIRQTLAEAIVEASEGKITSVYDKSADAIKKMTSRVVEDGFLVGNIGECEVLEHGHRFHVNAVTGQKTGFFLDQRENRDLLAHYAKDKQVLNMFGYTGGFSVYAAGAGATIVHTVDSSAPAIAVAEKNMKLNGFDAPEFACIVADARKYIETMEFGKYDLIVLDPPAYAKNVASRNQALKGYRTINAMALAKIKSGGILFTFSCSQVVDRQMFTSAVTAAAIDAGRQVRIIQHLSQPPDHPVNIFHQEGEYLKGLVLLVD
ncbi:MAG: class I SAM-dependent rRNA methyltransferase [Bacteroidales bacterium]|nr:class I SAM-dependent rRNA methyltransferase [Bacteroidales bacterium]